MTTYHFTKVSSNVKTGPIPVTTTSPDSCPPTCSFLGAGCYASNGPLAIHWRAVGAGRGGTLEELCEKIQDLHPGQLWRHNQAGDLPGADGFIDSQALLKICLANIQRRGFTYTHYKPIGHNLWTIKNANELGFTINLSAESLGEADDYYDTGLPVVVTLPEDCLTTDRIETPKGRVVMVCPASLGFTDCLNCHLCQRRDRTVIIGFPAHGAQSKHVQTIFFAKDIK